MEVRIRCYVHDLVSVLVIIKETKLSLSMFDFAKTQQQEAYKYTNILLL